MRSLKTNESIEIKDLGLAEYGRVLKLQKNLHEKRRFDKIKDTVLIVEHQPVITLGARKDKNRLLSNREILEKKGIGIFEIRRGGGSTAHNPGQLVFYPIIALKNKGLQVSDYIRTLESIGIELLSDYGIKAERNKGFPGLWIGQRKIASIGVRVRKMVTFHGMAININNDLSIFDNMVPCGLNDVKMTSVFKETGSRIEMQELKEKLAEILIRTFG